MQREQDLGIEVRPNLSPYSNRGALLAPLSGVTDVDFRRIARRFGADAVVTEMVASDAYVRGAAEARLRAEGADIAPHVVQLVGRQPAPMAEAARLAESAGADIIDINMGCPAKRVTGGLAGSALMRDLDLALRIIEAVVGAVTIPVTLKMRLGWDDGQLNAPELARRGAEAGLGAVTVHGRTRQQFYTGRADWRAIRAVVQAVAVPVIANGDIESASAAVTCLAESGASGVMIGRAALGRPWLVGQVAASLRGETVSSPSADLRASAVTEHYEGLLRRLGRSVGVRHARKHLAAYADQAQTDGFEVGAAERRELVASDEPSRVLSLLSGLFAEPTRAAA